MKNRNKKKVNVKVWLVISIVFMSLFLLSIILNLYLAIDTKKITTRDITKIEKIIGLNFTQDDRELMLKNVRENLANFNKIREITLKNSIIPALIFNPFTPEMRFEKKQNVFSISELPEIEVPPNLEDLAFYPVTALSQLIRTKKITSTQLTRMYLDRLKKYGSELKCVITLTENLAIKQALKADREIASGLYRGPLHGIPWGAKDLLATKGIKTTWGAMPYKNQVLDEDATVVKRLEEAGAVLVAKLSMGALAWGDVWFGGKTRNPWNPEKGSSGSSAGSASATSGGLVGFSIGTETWGSIVSPCTRCGVTGLRPTYGRVSRYGAMALSWSMDKIGPICRSVEDCAIVFNIIRGKDGKDPTVINLPFNWDPEYDIKKIRVGYLKKAFEEEYKNRKNDTSSLNILRSMGVELIPMELPDLPVQQISFILATEAAAAFDELTRSGKDDLLVRQIENAWPNVFRQARLIPAVDYIQANRIRTLVIQAMAERIKGIDVYIAPSFHKNLLLTNLTGHPAVVVPNGFDKEGNPTSITFTGNLNEESKTLRIAKAYQDATDFHLKHPDLKKGLSKSTTEE